MIPELAKWQLFVGLFNPNLSTIYSMGFVDIIMVQKLCSSTTITHIFDEIQAAPTWVCVIPKLAANSARSGNARYCVLWNRRSNCWICKDEYMDRGFRIFFPFPLTRVISSPCSTTRSVSPAKSMMCTDEFKKGGVQMMEHECGLILLLLLLLQSRSRTWCQATILSFGAVCYIFWQGIHGSTANGWRWEELIFEKPRTILFLRGTTEFEKGWEIDVEVWVVAVSLPVFGLILEWKPVRLVPVMRDIVCVEIDAPIVEFEAKNRWFGVFASSSLCCWPAWAHHFRSTLWFRLLKNAGKFKCVNPNMSTWKFGCDHQIWKKQSILFFQNWIFVGFLSSSMSST